MIRNLLSVLLCLISPSVFAQNEVKIRFKNADNRKLIEDVYVTEGKRIWVSDENGEVLVDPENYPLCLEVSHLSYVDTVFCLQKSPDKLITLFLEKENVAIPEAIISTAPRVVYGHDRYHVADYFVDDQGTVLLTYESEKLMKRVEEKGRHFYEGCRIVWLDTLEEVLHSVPVNGICEGFYKQFPDGLILKRKESYMWVDRSYESMFVSPLTDGQFEQYIQPIKERHDSLLVASNWLADYPMFDYLYFEENDSLARLLTTIEDEWLMKQFRAEYRWLTGREKLEAYRTELETGIDKEVVGGFMSGISQQLFYKPLYAPIFNLEKDMVIFDHHNDYILHFDTSPAVVDSVEIDYHRNKESRFWDRKVIQDPSTSQFYLIYSKTGKTWLREIDPFTGERSDPIELEHRYPDEISVFDKTLHYIYRPYESSQTRYLYAQSVNLVKKGQGR